MVLLHRQRKPNRLRHYDYSQSGWYFVTICTKNKEEYFGQMQQGKMMIMTHIGNIVYDLWLEMPKHFVNAMIDEFVVMPNHIHDIVVIGYSNSVGNRHACSLQNNEYIKRNHQLLFRIIGSFKSAVSKIVRKQLHSFQWQKSFYDHIIRNAQSLQKIREYIRSPRHHRETGSRMRDGMPSAALNPSQWNEDENNSNIVGIRHA